MAVCMIGLGLHHQLILGTEISHRLAWLPLLLTFLYVVSKHSEVTIGNTALSRYFIVASDITESVKLLATSSTTGIRFQAPAGNFLFARLALVPRGTLPILLYTSLQCGAYTFYRYLNTSFLRNNFRFNLYLTKTKVHLSLCLTK